ncbi:hypothetical protein BO94DRAFT_586900 [Aspergillus sclerotioniger CBS 115572]|uniref:Uncharacterized protein n=1 Tax=Aspergillus sclerotioniger CBS 115572 TaxID=1450535 RepID=A0A317WDP3_9EURO|nr:hypothetical protein BO94DRAFT_586900 [Aspergillus sclerotioniger CBS 115572]PWY83851.1 hypothetical protein BO94DRAFT_586900 [Aspergillus sclerotioniger CBS 115572]
MHLNTDQKWTLATIAGSLVGIILLALAGLVIYNAMLSLLLKYRNPHIKPFKPNSPEEMRAALEMVRPSGQDAAEAGLSRMVRKLSMIQRVKRLMGWNKGDTDEYAT